MLSSRQKMRKILYLVIEHSSNIDQFFNKLGYINNMVKSYWCTNCGYQEQRDINETGETLCPECSNIVTSVLVRTRKDTNNNENIKWSIKYRNPSISNLEIEANDYEHAIQKISKRLDDEDVLTKVYPSRQREP